MTDISFELENEELKEINLDIIEQKIPMLIVLEIFYLKVKKNILENIKDLNPFLNTEVFKIIKKYNIKYSENSNGVFINMNKLGKRTIK